MRLIAAILIISAGLLLSSAACKTTIKTFPVNEDDVPVQMLENGNYEVTKGYVYRHVSMMAEIQILKARIKELERK